MSFVWCTNTFFGWTLISAPQHERTVKLLHYELQEIAPFNVKLLAIFSVKHVTVSFLREQSCRWRSLTFISHSALQLSFFPLSGISHSLAFDNLGVGSISNERVQFKPVQKGTLKCTLTMLLVFLLKRSQYFHVSTVFESFALSLQSFFFFFGGGLILSNMSHTHLPRWKFPKRHAWPWIFSMTLNLTNRRAENTHNTFAVFRHRDPLWLVQSAGVSEPCCIAVGRGVHRELLLQKG